MAFLTFAEAKVVAPPILSRKYQGHTIQVVLKNVLKNEENEENENKNQYKT